MDASIDYVMNYVYILGPSSSGKTYAIKNSFLTNKTFESATNYNPLHYILTFAFE